MAVEYTPYELSGRLGAAWLLPVIGFASASVSAFAYAWLNVYSPVAGWITVVFVAMLAAGAALPIAWAARPLKVRNRQALQINGLITGLLAVYLAWGFFAWVFSRRLLPVGETPVWDILGSPVFLWDFARALAADGWFELGGFRPRGFFLWFLWAVEAAIVTGVCMALAPRGIEDRAFCEDCGRWMVDENPVSIPAQEGALAKAVRKNGLAAVTDVTPPSLKPDKWVRIDRARCPDCGRQAVFRVSQAIHFRGKGGKEDVALRPLLPPSVQTESVRVEIERIAGLLKEADRQRFEQIKRQRADG